MVAYVLTFGRLVLAAGFAVFLAAVVGGGAISTAAAAVLIALAVSEELTDAFDGPAARRFGTVTRLGGILDPLADSLGRLTIYFAMALAGWITIAVPLVMCGRDIMVAYTRVAKAATGQATSARLSGKLKAIVQGGGIVVVILLARAASGRAVAPETSAGLQTAVAAILIAVTLWSLADYLRAAWPAIRSMTETTDTDPPTVGETRNDRHS